MELFTNGDSVGSDAFSAMLSYLAERADLCAKVIDRTGEIIAVNARGLELLQAEAQDICGKLWTMVWSPEARAGAEDALAKARDGEKVDFVGEIDASGAPKTMRVEVLPLEWSNGEVRSLLVAGVEISRDKSPRKPTVLIEGLSEALHAMSNLANVSASSARLLSRASKDAMVLEIAEGLEAASAKASAAISRLDDLRSEFKD